MSGVTHVRDRRSGVVFAEKVFGGDTLDFLYGRHGRWLTDRVLSSPAANRVYGWLKRRPGSRAEIAGFFSSLGIDASEAEHPLDAYGSLDEFFCRKLRPGVRPIDPSPEHLVSPADARVVVIPALNGQTLPVKGTQITLAALVDDAALAERYRGGTALVARLAPADYHRFHFPDDGVASAAHEVEGRLHSVHPIALAAGAPSLQNRRSVTLLESAGFGTLVMVEVGALLVGTIVQTYRPGRVRRGDEKGTFRFGGSTVVLLAEPGRLRLDADLVSASEAGLETLVRMGERIGRRAGAAERS